MTWPKYVAPFKTGTLWSVGTVIPVNLTGFGKRFVNILKTRRPGLALRCVLTLQQ